MIHDGSSDSQADDKSTSYKRPQASWFIDAEQPPILADMCGGDIPITIISVRMRLPNIHSQLITTLKHCYTLFFTKLSLWAELLIIPTTDSIIQ